MTKPKAAGRMYRWFEKLIRRYGLRKRLILMALVISLVPMFVISCVSYVFGRRAIINEVSRSSRQTVEQISTMVGTHLQKIINDGIEIAYSDDVQDALVAYSSLSVLERHELKLELSKSINRKYIFNTYNGEVTLYTLAKEKIDAYGPHTFFFTPKPNKLDVLVEKLDQLSGRPMWLSVDADYEQRLANNDALLKRNSIVLARAIKSLNTGDIIGYITVRMNESTIAHLYNRSGLVEDSSLFIINSEGVVISTASPHLSPAQMHPDRELVERVVSGEEQAFHMLIDGEKNIVVSSQILPADWYMVAMLPVRSLHASVTALFRTIMLVSLLCVLCAVIIFVCVATSVIRPVRKLNHAMDRFGETLACVPVEESGQDEITQLTRGFNRMTEQITALVDNIRVQERQKRELEIRALQAQINPHFFANALNTVSYMARAKGAKNIEEMVHSIITLLNGCMKNDNSLSTVRESIHFMTSYATTQEYRMMGRFHIQIQIAPEIEDCLIPRFILQPIVENALIHGIEPSGRNGLVVVKGYRLDGRLHFEITDNGIGMPQEKIDMLTAQMANADKKRMTGIGIANVRDRLQLMYGSASHLRITSVEGVFTTVEIVMPEGAEKGEHESDPAG